MEIGWREAGSGTRGQVECEFLGNGVDDGEIFTSGEGWKTEEQRKGNSVSVAGSRDSTMGRPEGVGRGKVRFRRQGKGCGEMGCLSTQEKYLV